MNIAILGLGTIGYGVYDIINKHLPNLNVTKVFDRDLSKVSLVGDIITTDINDVINDSKIDVVVETLGGLDFPYKAICRCLEHHKHIVTANKEVISTYLDELTILKNKYHVQLLFEASVGGGIPIITSLIDIIKTNEVTKIEGIINGTTNYLLTRMNEGLSFDDALKMAQAKGFAEANPTNDLEGLDLVRKIAILTMIATQKKVNIDKIYHYGISGVTQGFIKFLKDNGYILKLLATMDNGFLGIEPIAVTQDNIFSNVNDEYNLISLNATNYDNLKFYGKGAGRYPTANAIVNDLLHIFDNKPNYSFPNVNEYIVTKDIKKHQFCIEVKDLKVVDKNHIFIQENSYIITNKISREQIDFENVNFYARIY